MPEQTPSLDCEIVTLRVALADALNYWQPACMSEDCEKDYHRRELAAWQRAKTALGEPHA